MINLVTADMKTIVVMHYKNKNKLAPNTRIPKWLLDMSKNDVPVSPRLTALLALVGLKAIYNWSTPMMP
jgi:hypothetical protein